MRVDKNMRVDSKIYGYEFVEFVYVREEELHDHAPLASSYAVIKCEGKYLLCYNSLRQQWELPAGRREAGETPKECAVRELYKETGQVVTELSLVGFVKSKRESDVAIKRNPVYFYEIRALQPFVENNESFMITLWNKTEQIGVVDSLDKRILGFVS